MIELWEWIVLVLLMVIMYLIGYYHLLDRLGAGLAAWWGRRHIRDKYESLKLDLEGWESHHDIEIGILRERLRAYFEHSLIEAGIWYDKPLKPPPFTIDEEMKLIICPYELKLLNAFYNALADKYDDILKPSHTYGYKIHKDWWVYIGNTLYKGDTVIRFLDAPLPETKKVPKIDGSDES